MAPFEAEADLDPLVYLCGGSMHVPLPSCQLSQGLSGRPPTLVHNGETWCVYIQTFDDTHTGTHALLKTTLEVEPPGFLLAKHILSTSDTPANL